MQTPELLPEIGKTYFFFDDGKLYRIYKATVLRIIPSTEEIIVDAKVYNENTNTLDTVPSKLQDIHKQEVDDHRQKTNWKILSSYGSALNTGDPYLYAEETDYYIECNIPEYDNNNIWFVRTVNGNWFSIPVQDEWQCGHLDVDGSKYNKYKEIYGEF